MEKEKRHILSLRCVLVPVTIQDTGDLGTCKLQLPLHRRPWSRYTSKYEDLFEGLTVYVSVCAILYAGVNVGPKGQA